ncbi:MAG: hypothetical protein K8T90_05425 [Planctomycetes bacterium]|nr:hypothetical protein [Planctomycetota bacterium]
MPPWVHGAAADVANGAANDATVGVVVGVVVGAVLSAVSLAVPVRAAKPTAERAGSSSATKRDGDSVVEL